MRVTILLFAQLVEDFAQRELSLDVEDGATVRAAIEALAERHPQIGSMRNRIAVAVDERYASPDTVLQPGQTVALIPPVSGG